MQVARREGGQQVPRAMGKKDDAVRFPEFTNQRGPGAVGLQNREKVL
jgi:hypothetical protein